MIELRAALKKNPDAPLTVGAESAAYRLGLSSRRPDREVIAAPKEVRLPKALRQFRIARWTTQHVVRRDGLPVWTVATLLAFMASQPSGYHDWPNVGSGLLLQRMRSRLMTLARNCPAVHGPHGPAQHIYWIAAVMPISHPSFWTAHLTEEDRTTWEAGELPADTSRNTTSSTPRAWRSARNDHRGLPVTSLPGVPRRSRAGHNRHCSRSHAVLPV